MSCNICHTPILVDAKFLDPNDMSTVTQTDHLDPIVEQVCPAKTHQPYYKNIIQIDRRFEGVVLRNLVHAGRGLFIGSHWGIMGGMALPLKQEEINNKVCTASLNVAHEGCWKLYCARIGVPFDFSQSGRDTMIALVERHEILGLTLFGGYEGIDYSEGRLDERWLVEPYGCGRANEFAWEYDNGEQDWTMKRPDMFPRLHTTPKRERLEICAHPTLSDDILSKSPDLVFLKIASHLNLSDLYTVAVLSKHLRHRCLTSNSYQNVVRNRLFNTWATPIPSEYPTKNQEGYAYATAPGDWLLYGHHVHKTQSMRNRHRIFNLIDQLDFLYKIKAAKTGYISGPNAEQNQSYLRTLIDQQLLLRKLNEMYDFELFVKALTALNKAYVEDLKTGEIRRAKLPAAVEKVKQWMVGKVALPPRRPPRAIEGRLMERINERLTFILMENEKNPRRRIAQSMGESIFED